MRKIEGPPNVGGLDSSSVLKTLSDREQMSKITELNRKYLHWDELGYGMDDESLAIWAVAKMLRDGNAERIRVCDLDLKFNLLPEFQEHLHRIDRCSAGFAGLENPHEKNAKRYAISSLMEEAIASSQMEGAATARKDAKKMLRAGRAPRNTGERMICNNYATMEHIEKTLDREMSIDLMLEMHKIIVNGTLHEGPEWEGRFREDNETVVGDTDKEEVVFHVPPKYELIPDLVQKLCNFINEDSKEFVHPITKGIIIHYLVGYIHPFVNGNGRFARLMYYWYVMKKNYWLMEYTSISRIIKNSKTKYGLAYQYSETDDQDITYFIRFNLECIKKAVEDLSSYIKRKTEEQKRIARMTESNPELNLNEMAILKDYSKECSPFTIKELSVRYHTSYQTARSCIGHLRELGYVKPVSKIGKTVVYALSEDMGLRAARGRRHPAAAEDVSSRGRRSASPA